MKIVVNRCFGGFGLSEAAYKELGLKWDGYGCAFEKTRTNPRLIAVVEKLGEEASSGAYAKLRVVEIPDDVKWKIEAFDGWETVEEVHRSW